MYFLDADDLKPLIFDGAAVYSDSGGRFTSAQIVLNSSHRVVTIRVAAVDGELVADKVVDKPKERRADKPLGCR